MTTKRLVASLLCLGTLVPAVLRAQQTLLDTSVFVDVDLRAAPFATYYTAQDLSVASGETRGYLVQGLSRLGMLDAQELTADGGYPQLRISVGCTEQMLTACPCEIGVTFELFGEAGRLSRSQPLVYAGAKEECITKAEVDREKLVEDLVTFVSQKLVAVDGFSRLVDALGGLEIAHQATPHRASQSWAWILPQSHGNRLLDDWPIFSIEGDFSIGEVEDVHTACEATYLGRYKGHWLAEVPQEGERCLRAMSALEADQPVEATVHLRAFARTPSWLELSRGAQ